MNIYLRKILEHDITHQISITREVLTVFFGVTENGTVIPMKGKNAQIERNVTILLSTDPRFGGDITKIIQDEGGMEINDIILFVKGKKGYVIEVIRPSDSRYSVFISLMQKERHLISYADELKDEEVLPTKDELYIADNCIFFGAPGTGKSFKVNKKKNELFGLPSDYDGECENVERVTFHPDYSYANFVGTYKPVPYTLENGEKKITYKYVPGPFMRIFARAMKYKNKPYLLIIEEINRANVAAVFGDIFQLLDRNKTGESEYSISASEDMCDFLAYDKIFGLGGNQYDYKSIKIPSNMFIWATMNSADQGVFPMDTAFKRRWNFEYIDIDEAEDEMKDYKFIAGGKRFVWNELRKAINTALTGAGINEDKLMGPFFVSKDIMDVGENALSDAIASKVIMYLFEDAAKQRKDKVFADGKNKRYSELVKDFKAKGLAIFVNEITKDVKPIEPNQSDKHSESEG